MTTSPRPLQLRLIIETADVDDAVHFYRDILGMPEQAAFATSGDDRVSILHAGSATVEIASPRHARSIEEIEGMAPSTGSRSGPVLRLALEVADTASAVEAVRSEGVPVLADAVETPFRSVNARVQGPAGWQVTFFQELESLEERAERNGFVTDEARDRTVPPGDEAG
ncbi:VOC family protein [Brachybacterium sp. FME24]|uniref:VOC family protein n=1 Tax=Brachybacterium sp. FME24 TaxID=2742605 RepID=UPI001868D3A2|nr:VOC family protein [Brachybacterium sp. FME24]